MKVWDTEGFLFDDGPQARLIDYPYHGLERFVARLRRRNPPQAPWWRRYIHTWQTFDHGRDVAVASQEPLVYGLTQVWNEDDVIYATVRNLFLQGCDEVFVIDDASDDESATEAKAAGATVIQDASDGKFHERRRSERICTVVDAVTEAAGRPVWWIMVDADEFPRGPGALTIRDLARDLPPSVDTVGSRVLEHYPGRSSAPRQRHHPLDELPSARWHTNPSCPEGHWKHQMLRLRNPGELRFMLGRHTIAAPPQRRPIVESTSSLLMHHFPLRGKEWTQQKFQRAGSASGRYGASSDSFVKRRLAVRLEMLRLAYEERYDLIPNMFPNTPKHGTPVHDWRHLVNPSEQTVHHTPGAPM
ncbi:glycosyltransferase family 2 protein [Actinomadura sp. 1N219]|uniref:glycosyltransferase family 2 protein n=1 Tax=Actinomadura sp. 1N219 TaxID=3375152 RepID=UPI003795C8AE